ncbi:MAG: hypothetical protein K0Q49_47 [Haloplasmataceae bacterium]|nr:hypothetical protein [Haloplasmataceae bacterium]
MKFEKYVNSKLFQTFNKLFDIIVINLMFIFISIVGLGIFTLFPALVATYILLQSISDDNSVSILKGFYIIIKKEYFKAQKLFLIIIFIMGILTFNTMFFYEFAISHQSSLFHFIGLFLFLFIDLFVIGLLLHIFPVYMYFRDLKPLGIIKFSALMVFAYPFKTLLLIILLFGWILLISLQPPIIPFICITIPIYIYLKLFQAIYKVLSNNEISITDSYFN